MRVAVIKNDVIENVIEAETIEIAAAIFGEDKVFEVGNSGVKIGWTRGDNEWVAPAEEAAADHYNVSKADIYRRCTDQEAEALHAALLAAPIRLQGIFNGATVVNTGDDYFPALRAGIAAALGETRADEVLAPSNI